MPVIELEIFIAAPPERCFDAARDIGLHEKSAEQTGERAVAGRMRGLAGLGDTVTFRARHFGVWQELTTRITEFNPPHHFCDEQQRGTFARMRHDHFFEPSLRGTRMRDRFDYDSPLGLLGRLADALFLEAYLRRFLEKRNLALKSAAESALAPNRG